MEKNKAKLIDKVKGVLAAAEEELHVEQSSEIAQELPQKEFDRRAGRILSWMDDMGISKGKARKEIEKIKEKSVAKLNEYDHHLEALGERNSYSKTYPDATFMRMKTTLFAQWVTIWSI